MLVLLGMVGAAQLAAHASGAASAAAAAGTCPVVAEARPRMATGTRGLSKCEWEYNLKRLPLVLAETS